MSEYTQYNPSPSLPMIPEDLFDWFMNRSSNTGAMIPMPDWFPRTLSDPQLDWESLGCSSVRECIGRPFKTLKPDPSPWGGMVLTSERDVSDQVAVFWGNTGRKHGPGYYLILIGFTRPGPCLTLALDPDWFADGPSSDGPPE